MPSMRQYAGSLTPEDGAPRPGGADPAGTHSVFVTARFTPGTCSCFSAAHAAAGSGACAKAVPHRTRRMAAISELRFLIRLLLGRQQTWARATHCIADSARGRAQGGI